MASEIIDSKNSIRLLTPQNTMDVVLEAIQEVIPYELAVILSKEIDNLVKDSII